MTKFLNTVLITTLVGTAVTGCKSGSTTSTSKFLEGADVAIAQVDNQSYIRMSSTFDLGNVSLSELSVTVIDPKTQQPVGTVGFSQLPAGQGKITLDVNTSLIVNGDVDQGLTLPNGRPLPLVLGLNRGDVMGIPILEHSRLYLGGDLKTGVTAGVALSIAGMDSVMSSLQTPANLFFMDTYGSVTAVGGIYGGTEAYQNGIAVFGKYAPKAATQMRELAVLNREKDFEIKKFNNKTLRRVDKFFHGKKTTHIRAQ